MKHLFVAQGGRAVRQISLLIFSAVVAGLTAAPVGAVELIVNGGFESGNFTPDPSPNDRYDTITQAGPQDLTGWTVGNSLVWGYDPTDINVHAGHGFVDLTGIGDTIPHGILTQTIPTLVGQQYTFSVFLTQDFDSGNTGINGIDVFADGVQLVLAGTHGYWNYNPTGATYGQLTANFIATDTSTEIRIQSIVFAPGFHPFMIGLDDVSVTGPALAGEVPVPAALPLFATGLGALGGVVLLRRKRKNAGIAAA